jgi:hypothetical protein
MSTVKNSVTVRFLGRGLRAAAIGAITVACATYFANLYIDSWHLAAQPHKPVWIYTFRAWEDTCISYILRFMELFGFGKNQNRSQFYMLTSIANALVAFVYLILPGFIWQMFRYYKRDREAVA